MPENMDSLHPNESYRGSENSIYKKTIHQAEFICSFENINNYPFDEQYCTIQIYISGTDNELTNLNPGILNTNGTPSSVGQYAVQHWSILSGPVDDGGSGVIIRVRLGRHIGSILLVTYLPTTLMNIINQATNYVNSEDKHDLIITINIT